MKSDKYIKKLLILLTIAITISLSFTTAFASSTEQVKGSADGLSEASVILYHQQHWYEAVDACGDLAYNGQNFARNDCLAGSYPIDDPNQDYLIVGGVVYPLAESTGLTDLTAEDDSIKKLEDFILALTLALLIIITVASVGIALMHSINHVIDWAFTTNEFDDF